MNQQVDNFSGRTSLRQSRVSGFSKPFHCTLCVINLPLFNDYIKQDRPHHHCSGDAQQCNCPVASKHGNDITGYVYIGSDLTH